MTKKRINLFSKKKQVEPIPTGATQLRRYGILFACASAVLCVISAGVLVYQIQRRDNLVTQLEQSRQLINQEDEIQGRIVFFVNKKEQLKTFLKDDANFKRYYDLLRNTLLGASDDSRLEDLDLGKNRDVFFTVTFTRFDSTEALLELVESKQFLDNFESLTLESFYITTIPTSSSRGDVFELQFRGIFKELPEATPAAAPAATTGDPVALTP
jgi:hypothetical protein